MRSFIMAAVAALLFATAASAASAAAVKPVKVNKNGLVCRTEKVLGSRTPKKVCFTPAQTAVREQEDRQNIERMQSMQGTITAH